MKTVAIVASLIITISSFSFGQTPCTIILKDRSVIEAYHIGTSEICRKGRKKTNITSLPLIITGNINNELITISDIKQIKELRIENYTPPLNKDEQYNLCITVKYKNGKVQKMNNVLIKCQKNNQNHIMSELPIQTKQGENNFQQIEIAIRNIDALIF